MGYFLGFCLCLFIISDYYKYEYFELFEVDKCVELLI